MNQQVSSSPASGRPPDYIETIIISEPGVHAKPITSPRPRSGKTETYMATELEKQYFYSTVKKQDQVKNKYRFQEKLVSGGMGAIFKVLDQEIQRVSAMKVILPKQKQNEDTLRSFILEAKITGFLEHPNIVPVHELGLLENTGIFFTMKLEKGESLHEILTELKRDNPAYLHTYDMYGLLNIFRKVCDAVRFAHSKKIIHRDIKPHNIMVGQFGEVLLMDWGLARYIGDPEDEFNPIQREILEDIVRFSNPKDTQIKGSPAYMAPEMIKSGGTFVDEKSDIFLLGATLYHMFTLEAPYSGEDIFTVLRKAENCDLIPPQNRNPARDLPEEISRIILKAMSPDKQQRYADVQELSKDIDDVISGKWSRQEKRRFRPGDLLMCEGEEGEEAYLILEGKVQVSTGANSHKLILGDLGAGDIVGEMALITKGKRSASVEAMEFTEVAVLNKDIMDQHLKNLPTSIGKIVSTLTDRLRMANTRINPHATTDSTYYILQQLRLIYRDRSDNHSDTFRIPIDDVCREISDALGVAFQKVKQVLLWAKKREVILIQNNCIEIPDISELAEFTKFGKIIAKIPLQQRVRLM